MNSNFKVPTEQQYPAPYAAFATLRTETRELVARVWACMTIVESMT